MPPKKVITIPSGSMRLMVTFLYSLPSIVLKSLARAIDTETKRKSIVTVRFTAPFISFPRLPCGEKKRHNLPRVKYWEIIADNLSKSGWSWGCVSAVDSRGRRIFVADAHRDDGKRFVVRVDEKLTAFVELESAIRGRGGAFTLNSGFSPHGLNQRGRSRNVSP